MRIKFTATKNESLIIINILARVKQVRPDTFDALELSMDLEAAHSNGCPLDFERLLAAPEYDFLHDIYGITRHLNRKTGVLENCFVPRCVRSEVSNG